MIIARTTADLRAARAAACSTVGFVPTMGALHDGHLSLIRAARGDNDCIVSSIFVNPAQFGPNEDFNAYPRTLEADLAQLEQAGVDIAFIPPVEDIYPTGFQTHVEVEHVSQGLEGARRPGHFRGVATIVAKLFNMTQPTVAYFGQKDAQQVVVLRRMVADLNFPLHIAVIPTARESDGLALSSRNRYLTPQQRADDPQALRALIAQHLTNQSSGEVEYISIAHPQTLRELDAPITHPVLASLTVRFGQTRLLDNILLPAHLNTRDGLTQHLGRV
ncbi:MAG: pantoate--beta-alanine ligase [Anaerolineae bacterium]|nr:pantoate--beta-alanine ligase [Anaerolineae bacterium]